MAHSHAVHLAPGALLIWCAVCCTGKKLEDFKNGFANLAVPFVTFSEPIAAPKRVVGNGKMEWTLWDRFDLDEGRDITLQEFLELFKQRHGLEVATRPSTALTTRPLTALDRPITALDHPVNTQVTMISSGVSILYSFFTNAKKLKERMPMTMSRLVTEVSKVEFKPKQRYVTFEICASDVDDDEDVEVPYVRYKFAGF